MVREFNPFVNMPTPPKSANIKDFDPPKKKTGIQKEKKKKVKYNYVTSKIISTNKNNLKDILPPIHKKIIENSDLEIILNQYSYSNPAYKEAVSRIPDDTPIWPLLNTKEAKIHFINYIFKNDKTPDKTYIDDEWVCRHFSAQMYFRYTNHPSTKFHNSIFDYKVDIIPAEKKFRIPIFYVTTEKKDLKDFYHAFNGIFIKKNSDDLTNAMNYYFISPQNRKEVSIGDSEWPEKSKLRVLEILDYGKGKRRTSKEIACHKSPGYDSEDFYDSKAA